MHDYGSLEILWFVLIGALWVGYFVLEGFDFGVGILLRVLGRDRVERRVLMHTIGPVWDGNEVWLIVAGGATFAAFPEWYATLLSGFYVPIFLIVVALLLRPVALEVWGKDDRPAWRDAWEWALVAGSAVPAFLWGVVFANGVRGIAIDGDREFSGSLLDVFNVYALLGGLAFLLFCAAHGAIFVTLKTRGEVLVRARRAALLLAPASAATITAFLAWTLVNSSGLGVPTVALASAAGLAAMLAPIVALRRPGPGLALHGAVIALTVATLFADLFPNVLVSSTNAAFNLTLGNAASGSYTLIVLTVVAAIFVPLVIAAQCWVYWIFRRRVDREELEEQVARVIELPRPAELLDERRDASVGR
jgi:cytochrome d ubiquinol oxidase subunit II